MVVPGQPEQLAASVDRFLSSKPPAEIPGAIVGLVAPHAGHVYSGAVAAYAFQAGRACPVELVAGLSPSHFHAAGALPTSGHDAYQTPLGSVPVDRAAVSALRAALAAELGWPASAALVEIQTDPR